MSDEEKQNALKVLGIIVVIGLLVGLTVYMFFFHGNKSNNQPPATESPNKNITPKTETQTNGEYYDYSKIDIKPTITILPAKIYDVITEIKGSVVSNTLASDDYNNNYVIYSGTDKATIITPDMIPKFNTKDTPRQTIDFIWSDVNSGKCYVPEYFTRDHDKIVLKDCSGNFANYSWEDGLIKHINSNKYVQTWNNEDLPTENDGLLLSKIDNLDKEKTLNRRKFDFIQSGDNLSNTKIIHQYSGLCVLPKVAIDGKVLLSVKSC
jgi:hypothetical protein